MNSVHPQKKMGISSSKPVPERKEVKEPLKEPNIYLSGTFLPKRVAEETLIEPPPKRNKWHRHIAQFRAEHPEMTFREALVEGKKTYKK